MKKTDAEIISTIRSHHALTEKSLAKLLGYKHNALHSRLRRMVRENKLKFIRLAGKGHTIGMESFPNTSTKLYYIYKKDLEKWIKKHLPEEMSADMHRATTHKFYHMSIQLPKPSPRCRHILIECNLHKRLKERAKKENTTICTLAEGMIKKGLEK